MRRICVVFVIGFAGSLEDRYCFILSTRIRPGLWYILFCPILHQYSRIFFKAVHISFAEFDKSRRIAKYGWDVIVALGTTIICSRSILYGYWQHQLDIDQKVASSFNCLIFVKLYSPNFILWKVSTKFIEFSNSKYLFWIYIFSWKLFSFILYFYSSLVAESHERSYWTDMPWKII